MQSDVEREYRFQMLLAGKVVAGPADPASFDRAREQLIDQKLLGHEAEVSGLSHAETDAAAGERLAELRKQFGGPESFKAVLGRIGMTEQDVESRLRQQEEISFLIDQQLRPQASVDQTEIQDYYKNTFVPEYARTATGPAPALANVRLQIREILTQMKMNKLLDSWLQQLRSSHRIKTNG